MAIIAKPHTFTAGLTKAGEASQVNADYDTIYAEFNGNIDNANIKANAAIAQSKISNLVSDLANLASGTYSTVASATSPDIFASAVGTTVDYTGTVTATDFANAPQAGARRILVCASTPSFTASANLLIDGIASGTTWKARAGDSLLVVATAIDTFRITPLVQGLQLLATASASASETVEFTKDLTSTYDQYLILITNLLPATDGTALYLRISQASVFKSGAANYLYTRWDHLSTATTGQSSASAAQIEIASLVSNTSTRSFSCGIVFDKPTSTLFKMFRWDASWVTSTAVVAGTNGSGTYTVDGAAIDGIQLLMSLGNITSGQFALYGIRKT